jgi:hypothetical protein
MKFNRLERSPDSFESKKQQDSWQKLQDLLGELEGVDLQAAHEAIIEDGIKELNALDKNDRKLLMLSQKFKNKIFTSLEKDLKIVPKGFYRTRWMIIGMSAFGIPFGVTFGISMDNMGLIGLGLPIGMGIGLAIGAGMDQKAQKEGRQLVAEL